MHRQRTDNHLLIWVTQGQGHVLSQNQICNAATGDLIVLDNGPSQTYAADEDDPWSILWIHFLGPASRSFFEQLRGSLRMNHRLACVLGLPSELPTLHNRFLELIQTSRMTQPDSVMLQECLLPGLLGMMIHQLNTPETGESTGSRHHKMASLLAYIDEHLHEPLSVDLLARKCNVSARQLHRLFLQQTSSPPLGYVQQQRVNKAMLLLSQTDLPVKEIAQAVGCDDAYYFSRLFKQHAGSSPRGYRQAKRGMV